MLYTTCLLLTRGVSEYMAGTEAMGNTTQNEHHLLTTATSHTSCLVPPGYVNCECSVRSTCGAVDCINQFLPSWLTKPFQIVVPLQPLRHHQFQASMRFINAPIFNVVQRIKLQMQSNTHISPSCSDCNELILHIKDIITEI